MRTARHYLGTLLVAAICLGAAGCGKKGDLRPPGDPEHEETTAASDGQYAKTR